MQSSPEAAAVLPPLETGDFAAFSGGGSPGNGDSATSWGGACDSSPLNLTEWKEGAAASYHC